MIYDNMKFDKQLISSYKISGLIVNNVNHGHDH